MELQGHIARRAITRPLSMSHSRYDYGSMSHSRYDYGPMKTGKFH